VYIPSTSRIFSNTNVNCTWSNHWHHHNARSFVAYHISNRLTIELDIGPPSLSLETTNYATFAGLLMYLKLRHTFCWSVPYITPSKVYFQPLFTNVVFMSPKPFFQLNHQVNISLHLIKATALCRSKGSAGLTPSWNTFSPTSLLTFQIVRSISFHYIST
jgi:hypothetical protein